MYFSHREKGNRNAQVTFEISRQVLRVKHVWRLDADKDDELMVNSVPTEKINSGRGLHLFILTSICENGTWCWTEPVCCARRWYFKQALYFLYSSIHTSYFIYNGTFVLLSCFVSRCFCTFVPLHIELVVESRHSLWSIIFSNHFHSGNHILFGCPMYFS